MFKPSSLTYGIESQLKSAQEHYDKYAEITKALGINSVQIYSRSGNPISIEKMRECFSVDHHLNNIPLKSWDNAGRFLVGKRNPLPPHHGISIAEGVCILKHVAIHIMIGEPRPFLSPEALAYYQKHAIPDDDGNWPLCGTGGKCDDHFRYGCRIPFVAWYND